jgi:hypothetical protein
MIMDKVPMDTIRTAPYVILIVALVAVPSHNPHAIVMHNVAGGMPSFPGRLGILQCPCDPIGRRPYFTVAYPGEMHFVPGIPSAQQPHSVLERQRARAVSGGKGGFFGDAEPLMLWRILERNVREICGTFVVHVSLFSMVSEMPCVFFIRSL